MLFRSLVDAGADSDREQAAARQALAEAGGTVDEWLMRAASAALRTAGTDEGTGLGLVAQAALRLRGRCHDPPCGALDRVDALRHAEAWGVAPSARAWTVVAWKNALDRAESAWDTPSFPEALDDIVEAAIADAAPLDRGILRHIAPSPVANLALTRALGAGDYTTRADVLRALRQRLVRAVDAVEPVESWKAALAAMRRRAAAE